MKEEGLQDEKVNYNPLDKDFIQTEEGFFFCIIGYIHPPNRVLSYLKYIPADSGKWKLDKQPLKRVLPFYSAESVVNTFEFLKKNYPQYLFYDNYNNIVFSAVPYFYIKNYYSSQDKLKEIFSLSKLDALQDKLKDFVSVLSELSGVVMDAFGVTGSILLDIHNPEFSDLDVTIHGYENSTKVKHAVRKIFDEANEEIKPLDKNEAERWQKDKVKQFGIGVADAKVLFSRKWNMGVFKETRFSLHPVKNLDEIHDNYGDKSFTEKGEIKIQGKVLDNSKALFLPAQYEITDVKILTGENVSPIQEVVSFEGIFDVAAERNEFFEAKGQLELVNDNLQEKSYYRVVIGSKTGTSNEYISVKL